MCVLVYLSTIYYVIPNRDKCLILITLLYVCTCLIIFEIFEDYNSFKAVRHVYEVSPPTWSYRLEFGTYQHLATF